MRKAVIHLAAASSIALAGVALSADWPQWRGPARTGHLPAGVELPQALPATPQVVWRFPVTDGLSSPVVAGGRVFHLDNRDNREVLHALDAATGKPIWSVPIDEAFKDAQSAPGPRCTPVVDGDRIYAQSCRGRLKCLSTADGKLLWEADYVKDLGATFIGERGSAAGASRHGYTGAPIVDGDHLIALAGGVPGASLVCFDKLTGKVVWKAHEEVPGYAAPVLAKVAGKRQLVAFMAGGAIGVDLEARGKVIWRLPVRTALARHVTTPVVVGEDLVIVSSHQAGMVAAKVTSDAEGFRAEQAWASKEAAVNFASPVAVGGHVYGIGPARNLICVEARTGKLAWSKRDLLAGSPGNAHGSFIAAGDRVLLLTDRGEAILFAADPAGYKELARTQVCGNTWCNPAYADGMLYVRDAKELRCVRLAP